MSAVRVGQCGRIASIGLMLAASACFDSRGRENAGWSPLVLPPGTEIPPVEKDEVLAKRIASNDGVEALVALHTGYLAGATVRYWDFGTASDSAEPQWMFRKRGAGGEAEPIDHPDLIDSVPGDMNYSPFRVPYVVYVTAAYDGERITSVPALEDAIEVGLLEEPEPMKSGANWPVVAADVQLELGDGESPLLPVPVYYRGHVATQLKLGATHEGLALERGSVLSASAYLPRRQNEPDALEEPTWEADLNADGDMLDSNVVFTAAPGGEGYSSLWIQVDVIVSPSYAWGELSDEAQMFTHTDAGLEPVDAAFVSYAPAEELLNRPLEAAP